jgi:hypothetical protein
MPSMKRIPWRVQWVTEKRAQPLIVGMAPTRLSNVRRMPTHIFAPIQAMVSVSALLCADDKV